MPFHKGSNHSTEFAGPTCPTHGVCCYYTTRSTPPRWGCPINGCAFTDASTPPPKTQVFHVHVLKTGWACEICGHIVPQNLVDRMALVSTEGKLSLADIRGESKTVD